MVNSYKWERELSGKHVSVWPGVAAPPSPGLAERERSPLAALIGEQWCL